MAKKPTALVDLDGTLADYAGAMIRDLQQVAGTYNPYERVWDATDLDSLQKMPHMKARMDLIKRQPGWWKNLQRLPNGFAIVDALKKAGFKLHVLTRGPKKLPAAWAEKVEWCLQNLPGADVTITHNKALVYGRILVDDWPPYIEPWLANRPRGLVIMPAQPWNRTYIHAQVFRYSGPDDDAELAVAIAAQRDRHAI